MLEQSSKGQIVTVNFGKGELAKLDNEQILERKIRASSYKYRIPQNIRGTKLSRLDYFVSIRGKSFAIAMKSARLYWAIKLTCAQKLNVCFTRDQLTGSEEFSGKSGRE